jgi:vacuolar-type H+-ATPase subunit I/STV1
MLIADDDSAFRISRSRSKFEMAIAEISGILARMTGPALLPSGAEHVNLVQERIVLERSVGELELRLSNEKQRADTATEKVKLLRNELLSMAQEADKAITQEHARREAAERAAGGLKTTAEGYRARLRDLEKKTTDLAVALDATNKALSVARSSAIASRTTSIADGDIAYRAEIDLSQPSLTGLYEAAREKQETGLVVSSESSWNREELQSASAILDQVRKRYAANRHSNSTTAAAHAISTSSI